MYEKMISKEIPRIYLGTTTRGIFYGKIGY